MIQHIVMWKFKEGCEAQIETFLKGLEGLYGEIDWIRSLSVRRSAVKDSAYDAVLITEFDSLEDVARYRDDPRHVAVAALCKEIRVHRAAIDIEK